MKKYIKKAILLASLALVLTACQADKVTPSTTEENTKIEIPNEEKENTAKEFEKLLVDGSTVEEIKKFIDEKISDADKHTADRMVSKLIELQKQELEKEIDIFYSEGSLHIQEQINKAYGKASSELEKSYVFAGKNKDVLLKNIEDQVVADDIKKLFDKGYGLYSGEGTYYPVIDYKEMTENYSSNTTNMTSEYLDIMANELENSTIIEEYLAINVSELKDRAFRYEEFLKNYPDSPYIEDIKLNYLICAWKFVNPNIFDGMLDDNFKVKDELNEVYKSILSDDSHPVTQQAVKGITAFIESKNGVLGSLDNMDELYEISYKLHKEVDEKLQELYLSE